MYGQNIKKGNGFPRDLLAFLQPTLSYHKFWAFLRIAGAMEREGIDSSTSREQSLQKAKWSGNLGLLPGTCITF